MDLTVGDIKEISTRGTHDTVNARERTPRAGTFACKHNATNDMPLMQDAIIVARLEWCSGLFCFVQMLQDRCPLRDDLVLEIEIDVIQYAPNR